MNPTFQEQVLRGLTPARDTATQAVQRERLRRLTDELLDRARLTRPNLSPVRVGVLHRDAEGPFAFASRAKNIPVVLMSESWMEERSDEQIAPVLAHELGHAVLGHVAHEGFPLIEGAWMLVLFLYLMLASAMSMAVMTWILEDHIGVTLLFAGIAAACVVLVRRLYIRIQPQQRILHAFEFEADAFAASLLPAPALLHSFSRLMTTRQRLLSGLLQPFSTHPSLAMRYRALGLVPDPTRI